MISMESPDPHEYKSVFRFFIEVEKKAFEKIENRSFLSFFLLTV